MAFYDRDVKLSNLLTELFRLMKRLETILMELSIILLGDASLAFERIFVVHRKAGLTKNFLCVLAPFILCLILLISSFNGGIAILEHLDNQLLRIGRKLFFDRTPEVAVQSVPYVVIVARVGELVGRFWL